MSSSSAEILTPEDQLGGLLELLRQGIQTKAHTKVFQLRQRIKTHCSKHGLPTPSEAFAHGRAPRGAIVSQAPPAPTVAVLPMATNREAQPLNVKLKTTKTGPERDAELKALTGVRDRARTLRGEAWKLIETVQGLPQEDLQALVEDLRYIALGASTALNVVKIRLGKP
jgi:hypothetical protein